jgi:hypothetical protein
MDPVITGWPGWVPPVLVGVVIIGLGLLLVGTVLGLDRD